MRRILFVHPDQKLSNLYVNRLQSHFLVDSAHNGLTAIRKFKAMTPSIIVSEYNLPVLSGLSLLRVVRSHPVHANLPFIFLSSHYDNSDALSFGANDWIDTHFAHPDYLLDRIYHNLKLNRYVQIN
jgi:two-component system, OmpR family, KDP operon response regulator KdpE